MRSQPGPQGLYDPRFEHDACGVAFVVDVHGRRSRAIVDRGITALLTVLVDGGDLDEPISDAVRSFVDGHIVLDRKIAERGFYPAIDVARSISRVATDVIDPDHKLAARKFREILATYDEVKDLIRIGMYHKGMNPKTDKAVELMSEVERFLKQDVGEHSGYEQTRAKLLHLASRWN